VDDNGDFWVRAIIEDDRLAVELPKEITFKKRQVSTSGKKGRQ